MGVIFTCANCKLYLHKCTEKNSCCMYVTTGINRRRFAIPDPVPSPR